MNNNNGARLETDVIKGERGTKTICLNGAAARHVQPGDNVIILSYTWLSEDEAKNHEPRVVILGEDNEVISVDYQEYPNTKL